MHAAIEFGNRMLTFVLAAVAIATWVAARRYGRRRCAAAGAVLALGIPAQAVIGGITVLTDLNPWMVAFHLLVLDGDDRPGRSLVCAHHEPSSAAADRTPAGAGRRPWPG